MECLTQGWHSVYGFCYFTSVMIIICGVIIAPVWGWGVTGSEASVYPSIAYEVPERSQGCCCGREGEAAVGQWAGLVSFLSPTPTGLRFMLAEVAGAAWLSLAPALSNRSLAPLAALFGEFEPCQEAPLPLPTPLRDRREAPLTSGFQKQQVSLPGPGQGLQGWGGWQASLLIMAPSGGAGQSSGHGDPEPPIVVLNRSPLANRPETKS